MSLVLYVFIPVKYIQPDSGRFGFCQNGGPIRRQDENVNPMALSTSGPNSVLLEESEANSPFIALTPLTICYDIV